MKGQTATEYLMAYGWAILIIVIIAGVLAYYGIFAPSGFLGQSVRGFSTLVVLQSWSLYTDGTLKATLENRVGSPIQFSHVYLIDPNDPTKYSDVVDTTTFSVSQKKIVTFSLSGNAIPPSSKMGDSFTFVLVLEFLYEGSYFNTTGTISGAFS